ncbi:unnamed protein product [Peniophora sp. CBMAI 1063]|nr:unnamed protein product [Peniophora sp. CBMAI 1063]
MEEVDVQMRSHHSPAPLQELPTWEEDYSLIASTARGALSFEHGAWRLLATFSTPRLPNALSNAMELAASGRRAPVLPGRDRRLAISGLHAHQDDDWKPASRSGSSMLV